MENIYESDFYFVRAYRGSDDANAIICSFAPAFIQESLKGSFYGEKVARRLDLPWIGLVARSDGFYREADYEKALTCMVDWMKSRSETLTESNIKRVGYGASMGGYGVLKYSKILDLDYVIAFAPQWSLDPDESKHETRYRELYRDYMKGMGIRKNDVQGEVWVFYDPYEWEDSLKVAEIEENITIQKIPVFFAGHIVVEIFKGSQNFRLLIEAIFEKKLADLAVTAVWQSHRILSPFM